MKLLKGGPTNTADIRGILDRIPHRYPFLLVDRVKSCDPGSHIVALKNVTINEPFFCGHFPQQPVMPGVLIIEALAQAALLLGFASTEGDSAGKICYFLGIDKARFKRAVVPGDQLELHATLLSSKRGIWQFDVEALVDGQRACSARIMAAPQTDVASGEDA
jgi:3-hydroxyacyl-[acyl-carrier-protein] dehydratase